MGWSKVAVVGADWATNESGERKCLTDQADFGIISDVVRRSLRFWVYKREISAKFTSKSESSPLNYSITI